MAHCSHRFCIENNRHLWRLVWQLSVIPACLCVNLTTISHSSPSLLESSTDKHTQAQGLGSGLTHSHTFNVLVEEWSPAWPTDTEDQHQSSHLLLTASLQCGCYTGTVELLQRQINCIMKKKKSHVWNTNSLFFVKFQLPVHFYFLHNNVQQQHTTYLNVQYREQFQTMVAGCATKLTFQCIFTNI